MDNSLSESARFAVYREKLKGICEANNLSYVFIKNAYPIKLVIRPLGGVGEQMSMLEEASEDNYISPGASILFTVKDGNLTYRMSKTFTISDTLFNKIKNIFKNKSRFTYWVSFTPEHKVYGCEFARHEETIIEILTAFFGKSIAGYSLDTLKRFILRSFEIRSDNSSVRSIAEDVDFIQRAVFARSFGNGRQEVPK